MARRHISLWFACFAIDRWRHDHPDAALGSNGFVLVEPHAHGPRLAAIDTHAARSGLTIGRPLGEARALVPDLMLDWTRRDLDAAMLARFAGWAQRWTPLVSEDAPDGLALDITGCAHLFGGESALIADLRGRFRALGFTMRAAIADTAEAAWMQARFGRVEAIAPGRARDHLLALPIDALGPDEETRSVLHGLGIRLIGDLETLPRVGVGARFPALLRKLDAALGRRREAGKTNQMPPRFHARLGFAEPIASNEALAQALDRLLASVTKQLERSVRGARRLLLVLYRVDGTHQTIQLDTSGPSRNSAHLARLFAERFDKIDCGYGIDAATLTAIHTDAMPAHQLGSGGLLGDRRADPAPLIDRLRTRLGPARVLRVATRDSHLPERAARFVIADRPLGRFGPLPQRGARPLFLLPVVEPIEAVARVPDHPPRRFTWRKRSRLVLAADGPERIEPEWWRDVALTRLHACRPRSEDEPIAIGDASSDLPDPNLRDYYRVQADDGVRYWLFRVGLHGTDRPAKWYLHGVFA